MDAEELGIVLARAAASADLAELEAVLSITWEEWAPRPGGTRRAGTATDFVLDVRGGPDSEPPYFVVLKAVGGRTYPSYDEFASAMNDKLAGLSTNPHIPPRGTNSVKISTGGAEVDVSFWRHDGCFRLASFSLA